MRQNKEFDQKEFDNMIRQWHWLNSTSEDHSSEPTADPVATAKAMYDKY